nr:MAG TPA: cysteine-rich protein [Caudoviricetes sp.]
MKKNKIRQIYRDIIKKNIRICRCGKLTRLQIIFIGNVKYRQYVCHKCGLIYQVRYDKK